MKFNNNLENLILEKILKRKELEQKAYELFDYYDDKYFNGSLKKCGIKINFKTTYTQAGVYLINEKIIGLKPKLVQQEDILKSILLHEMIHAYIICVEKDLYCGHCKKFKNWMNKINQKENLKVPISIVFKDEYIQNLEDERTNKYKYAVIVLDKNNHYYITVFSTKITEKQALYYIQKTTSFLLQQNIKIQKIYLIYSDSSLLNLFIARQKYDKIILQPIPNNIANQIIKTAKIKKEFSSEKALSLNITIQQQSNKKNNQQNKEYLIILYLDKNYLKEKSNKIFIVSEKLIYNKTNYSKVINFIDNTINIFRKFNINIYLLKIKPTNEKEINFIKQSKTFKNTTSLRKFFDKGFYIEKDFILNLLSKYKI